MNLIRQSIRDIVAIAQRRAVVAELKGKLDERLFLFGVGIGRGKKLTRDQRRLFANTFRTARIMLVMEDDLAKRPPVMIPIKNILKEPEEAWLIKEPIIRAELQGRLHRSLDEIKDSAISTTDRFAIIGYLDAIASERPDLLSPDEVDLILDWLDDPLDPA
jgi:hypothetical protein